MAYFIILPKEEPNAELLACRVCLATETKLFHLPTHPIAQNYALLTGTALSFTDGLPQHICTICSSQLLKYAALRAKCRTAQVILQVAQAANQFITTEYLHNLDRSHLRHNLFSTNTQNINILAREANSSNSRPIDLTVDDCVKNILPEDQTISDCDEKNKEIVIELIKNDDTFGCIAEDIDCTSIKNDDNSSDIDTDDSLLPDCLIGLGLDKDVIKDSVKSYKGIKSKLKKTNIKSEFKDRVASNTNTKTGSLDYKRNTKIVKKEIKRKKATKVETNKKTKIQKIQEDEKKVTRNVQTKRRRSKRTMKEIENNWSKMYNVEIVLLTKEEQRKQLEARKQTKKYLNLAFKCEICFRAFSEESMFKEHMTVHDPSRGEAFCNICQRYFSTKKALGNHKSKQHHRRMLVCKQCSYVSKSVMNAKDHYNSHNGVKVKCEYCEKTFNKLKSKIEHIRIHHGSTPCVICGEGFTGAHGLKMHMNLTHPEALDAVCSTCSVQFHSAEALSKHACEPGALPCAQCGDSFSTDEALKQHQQEQHKKEIECKTCNRSFTSDRWYKTHCINVHGLRSKEVLNSAGKMWVKRFRNQDFMCEICGSCHQNEATLINHQRIHSGEKPYKCDHCPKSFRLKMQRQHHMYTHTGERPYKCPDCPKAFKSASAKFRHYLVHSKKRPHVCDICGKTYQTTTVVKMHIRTVHLKETMPRRVRPRRTNSQKAS